MKEYELNRNTAREVLKLVDRGLTIGLGHPRPGEMCVEAVVCYALGLPHGDDPPCVGGAVRTLEIELNDRPWTSNKARARGMRRLAIAQLASDKISQSRFVKELTLSTIRKVVPHLLREAAKIHPDKEQVLELELAASNCAKVCGLGAARKAVRAAECTAKSACRTAFTTPVFGALAMAEKMAWLLGRECRPGRDYSSAGNIPSLVRGDETLELLASAGIDALKKAGSPGCKWLDLCD